MPITPLLAYSIVESGNYEDVKSFVDKVNNLKAGDPNTELIDLIKVYTVPVGTTASTASTANELSYIKQAAAKATQTATENRKEEPIATDLLIFQCLLHVSGGLNKIVSDLTLASVLLTNAGKDDNITKDEVTKAKAAADKATDDAVKVKAQTDAAAASPAALAEGEPVTNANLNTAADALEAAGKALDAAALLLEATPAAGAPGGTTAGDVASLSEHHKELLTEIIKKLTPEEVMELFVLILKMINKNP